MSEDKDEVRSEATLSLHEQIQTILNILPKGIVLSNTFWNETYQGYIEIEIKTNEKTRVYSFKRGETENYYGLQKMQDLFHLTGLYKKILGKSFSHLSDQEKQFLYRYDRIRENIDNYT